MHLVTSIPPNLNSTDKQLSVFLHRSTHSSLVSRVTVAASRFSEEFANFCPVSTGLKEAKAFPGQVREVGEGVGLFEGVSVGEDDGVPVGLLLVGDEVGDIVGSDVGWEVVGVIVG